jgi:hypothetical protein
MCQDGRKPRQSSSGGATIGAGLLLCHSSRRLPAAMARAYGSRLPVSMLAALAAVTYGTERRGWSSTKARVQEILTTSRRALDASRGCPDFSP